MNFEESISNIKASDAALQADLSMRYNLHTPILCKHCIRFVIYEHRNDLSVCDGVCVIACDSTPQTVSGVWSTDAACKNFLPRKVSKRKPSEKRTCSTCKTASQYRRGFKGSSAITYHCLNEKSGHKNVAGAYSCPFHTPKKGRK